MSLGPGLATKPLKVEKNGRSFSVGALGALLYARYLIFIALPLPLLPLHCDTKCLRERKFKRELLKTQYIFWFGYKDEVTNFQCIANKFICASFYQRNNCNHHYNNNNNNKGNSSHKKKQEGRRGSCCYEYVAEVKGKWA
ncbi:hypothetical protein TRVL_01261 [Trypanosoma vivax]|nr:hypothetical protein TRVL_01261 [Trypanosoma vivax]